MTAQRNGKTTVLEMLVTLHLGNPFARDALKKPKRLLTNTSTPTWRKTHAAAGFRQARRLWLS